VNDEGPPPRWIPRIFRTEVRTGNIAVNIATPARSNENMFSLDAVRSRLAVLWLTLGCFIFLIVVVQFLLNNFGSDTQKARGWLLPTIMPTLGMIISVLGYTALDPNTSTSVVRKSFFWVALFLSGIDLRLILITILIHPFVAGINAVELMLDSHHPLTSRNARPIPKCPQPHRNSFLG
jgi:hypothetical protein